MARKNLAQGKSAMSASSRARLARGAFLDHPWYSERPLGLSGEGSVRDHVDLDFRIDHQACCQSAAAPVVTVPSR